MKRHEHQWVYDRRTCCYVLRCIVLGCDRLTTAYYVSGDVPQIGDPVILNVDDDSITRIGSSLSGVET